MGRSRSRGVGYTGGMAIGHGVCNTQPPAGSGDPPFLVPGHSYWYAWPVVSMAGRARQGTPVRLIIALCLILKQTPRGARVLGLKVYNRVFEMVGVPGKYKGCNTCRARRVACDNGRPFCKKCTDYGRECGGYERETVFIVGTPDDKGRCSSHPPRNQQGSKKAKISEARQAEKLHFVATEPWQPAWMDVVSLSSAAGSHRVRFFALQTDLSSAIRPESGSPRRNEVTLSLGGPRVPDANLTFRHEPFSMKARCLIYLPPKSNSRQAANGNSEGLCLFLYEQNSSAVYSNEPPWKDPAALHDRIREPGPGAYQSFPEHHFFARVYRPNAIWAALLNRQPTFLCSPEWTVVPWERHPRTPLDDLLDIVVLLPSIFSRADRITPMEASASRRLKAKDLLISCINIERQFDIWYSVVHQRVDEQGSPLYWVADATASGAQMPFLDAFSFPSPLMGLVHVCYWAVLVSFHQCICALLDTFFESGSEDPSVLGVCEIPLGVDIRKYQPGQTRMIAANLCRSLDFTLQTTGQPDLLAAPFFVVSEFYNSIACFGEGGMERQWCAGFRGRLDAKSREASSWLEERKWIETRQFG
ncbi:uncharacterized protein F4807DRAFT_456706 [Annulohypoxylon truncatum]|uniref:uncharacterized protein n=1 Tax=Annulohypoxylon truncatum TaxID=327061 RepID=UPI002007B3C0|nr:uncharacterized protein F4807DRAFT_456706 [Annulohypoxylon truncatum]KAI1213364.1 hypothetical protein F4807DRAFT_456706 [Annulohypoxylon truncatum]